MPSTRPFTDEERKERKKLASAKYWANNYDKALANQRANRIKHRDRINAQKKIDYAKNREKIYAYKKKKRDSDIQYLLADRLRCRVYAAINGGLKIGSAIADLGCSKMQLKNYIESKFQPGMSWDNRSEWHIDHVVPLSWFDLTNRDQFLNACNYTNLQPLWAVDNLQKSNRYAG